MLSKNLQLGRLRDWLKSIVGPLTTWERRVAALSLLLGLATLAEVTEDVAGAVATPAIDRQISTTILELRSEPLTEVFLRVTALAHSETIFIVAVVALVGAFHRQDMRLALPVLGSIAATAIVVLFMKDLIGRERPLPPINLVDHSSAAYPSGHSAHSVGSWGALIWLVFTGGSALNKTFGAVIGFIVAAAVGFSRLYLGVHWASDVVAGWAVGGICLSAAILVSRQAFPSEKRRRRPDPTSKTRAQDNDDVLTTWDRLLWPLALHLGRQKWPGPGMSHRRFVLGGLAVASLGLAFGACGGSEGGDDATTTSSVTSVTSSSSATTETDASSSVTSPSTDTKVTPHAQQPTVQDLEQALQVFYWLTENRPVRMDADLNGRPCETIYPTDEVNAFWDAARSL